MPLENISAQKQMTEIARMAYGSGFFEGTSGGKGNIGLITGADGQARVIKFNTHWYERGGVATEDQIKSSNALRAQLLSIAETLNPDVVAELRTKLGLGEGEDIASCKKLLTRSVVASALKMIDADAMTNAMRGVHADSLKSLGDTKFEDARVHANYGISSTTLQKCGMSAADFEEAMSATAARYNLTEEQKQVVGRTTASYMTAIAEEGRTGQLDETGELKQELPSKDEIKSQISDGTFCGTYLGLTHVRAVSPTDNSFVASDNLVDDSFAELSRLLSDEECVDAAYYMTKIGMGPRAPGGYNSVSALGCKAILDKRAELSAIRQQNGKLTINDFYETVLGEKVESVSYRGTAVDFTSKLARQMYLHYKKEYPEAMEKRWSGDLAYMNFEDDLPNFLQPMNMFGMSIDDAMKIGLHVDVDKIEVSDKATAYPIGSRDYQNVTEEALLGQIDTDFRRAPNSVYNVGTGKDAYQLKVGAHPPKGDNAMLPEAKEMMKAFNRMLGGGDEVPNPVPNQLKTISYLATQGGNTFLSLAGINGAKDGQDHFHVDKSFTKMDDGAVLYTASTLIGDTVHTAQVRIEENGENTVIGYTRTKVDAGVIDKIPGKDLAEKGQNYEKLSKMIREANPSISADGLKSRMSQAAPMFDETVRYYENRASEITARMLPFGDSMISDITNTMEKLVTAAKADETSQAVSDFATRAQNTMNSLLAGIKGAQADFKRGAIDEFDYQKRLKSAHDDFSAAFGGAALKPVFNANKELSRVFKAIGETGSKQLETYSNAAQHDIVTRHATQLHDEIMKLPGAESLPKDLYAAFYNSYTSGLGGDKDGFGQYIIRLINEFRSNPEQFKLSADQMTRINALAPNAKAAERLAKALFDQKVYEILLNQQSATSFEDKIQKFEANGAELAGVLEIVVREDLTKEQICNEFGKLIEKNFNHIAEGTPGDLQSFDESGLHVQALRETTGGALTFNGVQVAGEPGDQAKEKFARYGVYSPDAIKYAETLTTKFDDNHKGMRKMVSLLSGMADGVQGIIDEAFYNKQGESTLADVKHNRTVLGNKTDSIFILPDKDMDKNEFTIAENGDVLLKTTKVMQNQVTRIGGIECATKPDRKGTIIAETKFEVTIRIPSQSDAELNGGMPKFEVIDFVQEVR